MTLITPSEFECFLENADFPLAVAVSGGADSLALLLLSHELAQKKGSHVIALTVDHGLRAESKAEAIRVGNWAAARGIQHVVLSWDGDKPDSRLQESARKARYGLLTKWCQAHQISTLLLGHHQQDQEETFWLRLAAGSGLDGLSGMKKRILRDGIIFLRPLLDFPKERLEETLLEKNQEWIEDPSNQNSRFFRGRLRSFFSEEGLSSFRLSQVMKKFQVDTDYIQQSVKQAIKDRVQLHEEGYVTVKKDSFNELHPAIGKRLISFLVQWFSNPAYAPRESKVMGILGKIKEGHPFTAGGIYWTISREEIFLTREKRAIQEELPVLSLQEKTLWDQRFWIDVRLTQHVPKDIVIKPMGFIPGLRKEVNSCIPAHTWSTLPALWEKGKVVAVPHLCYDLLKCEKDLRKYIYLKPLFHDSLRITI